AIDEINARAETLAKLFVDAEAVLADPNDPSTLNRPWVAVRDGEDLIVGTYQRDDAGQIVRTAVRGANTPTLLGRLAVTEQVLALAPLDCGDEFAVLDAGIREESHRRI